MCFDFLRLQHMYISITFRCDGYIGKMRFECHLAVHKHDPAYSAVLCKQTLCILQSSAAH